MKYLPLLLIVFLFYCCWGKYPKDGNGTVASAYAFKDTMPSFLKSDSIHITHGELHVYRIYITPSTIHPNSYAYLDTFGVWTIHGQCSDIIETLLAMNKTLSNYSDSLQRELNIIKGNKAAYDYACDTNIIIEHGEISIGQCSKRFTSSNKNQ